MSQKGGNYERDLCRDLTEWWTGDPDRDVCFWRTSQSGGRATFRSRKGKKTTGAHCGDITAIEKIGEPLTDLITIEIKRGYNKGTVNDLIDKPLKGPFGRPPAEQILEGFLRQSIAAAKQKGTKYWMLIHKRDKRETVVYFPCDLQSRLVPLGTHIGFPSLNFMTYLDGKLCNFVLMSFKDFLARVDPEDIKILSKRLKYD